MKQEIWKPIKGYEEYYEISNFGIVRRIRYDNIANKKEYKIPNYIKSRLDKDGYVRYTLSLKGKTKMAFAHRLVAEAFIPNPNNLPQVNHIDGNKQNNHVDNLEWCTIRENNIHALKTGLRDMKNNKLSKKVGQYDLNNKLINTFLSSADVERKLGICSAHVRNCCRGKLKTYKGFIWKYI